jgi:hypothetical protein
MKKLTFVSLLGLSTAFIGIHPVTAEEIFDPSVSTATGTNNSAVVFGATVQGIPGASTSDRWVGQVFASSNECLRVHVITEAADLETVVVRPDGLIARNDDTNGSLDRRPLVKILTGSLRGWYTVSIGEFSGAPVLSDFTLAYARYNAANPNCATPTPISAPERSTTKSGSSRERGPAHGPTSSD